MEHKEVMEMVGEILDMFRRKRKTMGLGYEKFEKYTDEQLDELFSKLPRSAKVRALAYIDGVMSMTGRGVV